MGASTSFSRSSAPPSVAAGNPARRSRGHSVAKSRAAWSIPNFRGGLLESLLWSRACSRGASSPPRCTQAARRARATDRGDVRDDEWRVEELASVVRPAYPYSDLGPLALESVLDVLSGRYPSDDLRAATAHRVGPRGRHASRARRPAPGVTTRAHSRPRALHGEPRRHGRRVGELDEEMSTRAASRDVHSLGASTWPHREINQSPVLVTPGQASRESAFWHETRRAAVELGLARARWSASCAALEPARRQSGCDPRRLR